LDLDVLNVFIESSTGFSD